MVLDVSEEDKKLFIQIYKSLMEKIHSNTKIKIILQTFFGDIRDVYEEVCSLGFDAITLDFVEGKKSLDLIKANFPKDTLLFAGIVNGKNIWRADYKKKNTLLEQIKKYVPQENIIIGTSCSLLHVPYTTTQEEKLEQNVKNYFSFAEEKLSEIKALATQDKKALLENEKLFATERVSKKQKLHDELSALTDDDFTRKPSFEER